MKSFDVPILFMIFNRPDVTNAVFEEIKKARPKKLFIAADGPRADVSTDTAKCAEARKVSERIDWPCEVKTLFRKENLGCGYAVSGALDWFFQNVEQGIILEDDCLPDQSFFPFCEELLERYKDDKRIMHISGNNFQYGKKRGFSSYYFSEYPHIWGWATWRRAWQHNDFYCVSEEDRKANWDAQWWRAVTKNKGFSILPNANLVSNIGFGVDATHTKESKRYAQIPRETMLFPLIHPRIMVRHVLADLYTYRTHFEGTWKNLVKNKLHRFVPKAIKKAVKNI